MVRHHSKKDTLRDKRRKFEAMAAENSGAASAERDMAKRKLDEIRVQLGEIPADAESWNADVAHGRELLRSASHAQWALGELATSVNKRYGEANLAKFAAEIGLSLRTLQAYRATFVAWFGDGEVARKRPVRAFSHFPASYAVARALNRHPDRWALVMKSPLTEELAVKMAKRNRDDGANDGKPSGFDNPDRLAQRAIALLKKFKPPEHLLQVLQCLVTANQLGKKRPENTNELMHAIDAACTLLAALQKHKEALQRAYADGPEPKRRTPRSGSLKLEPDGRAA